jgi:hypothetical protein
MRLSMLASKMVLLQRCNFTTTGFSGKRESDGYRRLRRTPSPAVN